MIIACLRTSAFMICTKGILRLLMILIVCTGASYYDGCLWGCKLESLDLFGPYDFAKPIPRNVNVFVGAIYHESSAPKA